MDENLLGDGKIRRIVATQGSKNASGLVSRAIDDLRRRLLDISNRNPLLNFKHRDRSKIQVRLVDRVPEHIYASLVDGKIFDIRGLPPLPSEPADERTPEFQLELRRAKSKDEMYRKAVAAIDPDETGVEEKVQTVERELRDRLRIKLGLQPRRNKDTISIAEHARQNGITPSYDLPKPQPGQPVNEGLKTLQTLLLAPDALDARLGSVWSQARLNIQETGVDTLYLAIGFLEWRENMASSQPMIAPLLLLPISIEKSKNSARLVFKLKATGEEMETNICLAERLRQDFGLELPKFDPDHKNPIGHYLQIIERGIRDLQHWRIRRWMTIGHFSFARLVMYKDLADDAWNAGVGPKSHSIVKTLLTGRSSGAALADDYEIETERVRKLVPVLIHDADSSQHSAIVDIMENKNLVIEGPPGTGKSQTITNVIANALFAGRRVLFVAEKMAALDVVKKRLDDAGLGHFCLELHSTKSRPQTIIEDLKRRDGLSKSRDPATLQSKLTELEVARSRIMAYIRQISQRVGNLDKTVHELIWMERKAVDELNDANLNVDLQATRIKEAIRITPSTYEVALQTVPAVERAYRSFFSEFGEPRRSPWRLIGRTNLSPIEAATLFDLIEAMHVALYNLSQELETAHSTFDFAIPATLGALHDWGESLKWLCEPFDQSWPDVFAAAAKDIKIQEALSSLAKWATELGENDRQWCAILETEPSTPDEVERLRRISTLAKRLNLSGKTLLDVDPAIEGARLRSACIDQLAAFADIAAQILPRPASLTSDWIRFACHAIEIAAPGGFIDRTTRRIARRVKRPSIEQWIKQSDMLGKERRRLEESFRLAQADMNEIAGAIAHLSNAGFLSILKPSVRQAKRVFLRLYRGSNRLGIRAMGTRLKELLDYLELEEEFNTASEMRHLLGDVFQGTSTRFDIVLEGVAWAELVESTFQTNASGETIKNFLYEAEHEKLSQLGLLVPQVSEARNLITEEFVLDRERRQISGHVAALEELRTEIDRATIPLTCRFGDLALAADAFERAQQLRIMINALEPLHNLLGKRTAEAIQNPSRISKLLSDAKRFAGLPIMDDLKRWILADPDASDRIQRVQNLGEKVALAVESTRKALDEFSEFCDPQWKKILLVNGHADASIALLMELVKQLRASKESLDAWLEYESARTESAKGGLQSILDVYDLNSSPYLALGSAYRRVLARSILETAYTENRELGNLRGKTADEARARFQTLDREVIRLQRQLVASQLSRLPVPDGQDDTIASRRTGLALLRHEMSLRKPRTAPRNLLRRAGNTIQAMKPCFMMSPMSVAKFLDPNALRFDLLVIDEASQMRPEDAIGAIARCGQITVVGDPKQLPPTSFFDRLDVVDEDEDDSEQEDARVDMESILDLAYSVFRPSRHLRWHYRSRHESLIAFSNRHFYDENPLVVFPSPHSRESGLGVALIETNSRYDAGRNVSEARSVVEKAITLMARYPDRSMGIVAINIKQKNLIEEEIEYWTARETVVENYRAKWDAPGSLEPLFVKNLENVQGDERDIILVSLTYGPDPTSGKVRQNFGPVNRAGGDRRLNVLFTRARYQMFVFSSMKPDDIVISETSPRGVRILRAYLDYARNGRIDPGQETGAPEDSDFEISVRNALMKLGYDAVPQVGVAGFRIDLAVRNPDAPGSFLLGIECDGAAYHRTQSTRDRDRIRQEILESLGWTICRVWSTDWFRDPERQLKKLAAEIEAERYRVAAIRPTHSEERPDGAAEGTADIPGEDQDTDERIAERPLSFGNHGPLFDSRTRPQSDRSTSSSTESSIELKRQLTAFRDNVIMREMPESDPSRCILRPSMIDQFVEAKITDGSEFKERVPISLRTMTDSRQMKYLGSILDILVDIRG